MDKHDFLTALYSRLHTLPEEDARRSVDYYCEMIDDRIEDGLSEDEAVAAVGDVDEIAATILANTALPQPVVIKEKPKRKMRWWEIVLLILGSPLWLALLIAAAAVIFSIWICLWCGVICLYAVTVSLAASAAGCSAGGFLIIGGTPEVLIALGMALACGGLSVLFFLLSKQATKGMIQLTKWLGKMIKKIFTRKEQTVS